MPANLIVAEKKKTCNQLQLSLLNADY
uniref:Uncharacterized protein n=1 Tax=Arundo donax TaxID=35708 RepID=A0A0A8ZGB7_ARUDO